MLPRALLIDLLMATMDSITTWSEAAGDRDLGLAWRDAVTARMIEAGRYTSYDALVADAADELGLPPEAPAALRATWSRMRAWPDAAALAGVDIPYAFVTNCSSELAAVAVERSGLRPAFAVSAEEAGWFKPRREIYLMAAERLDTGPDTIRFVAGAAYDANGASAAGLSTVLVARRGRQQPLNRAISVVDSLLQAVEDVSPPLA